MGWSASQSSSAHELLAVRVSIEGGPACEGDVEKVIRAAWHGQSGILPVSKQTRLPVYALRVAFPFSSLPPSLRPPLLLPLLLFVPETFGTQETCLPLRVDRGRFFNLLTR